MTRSLPVILQTEAAECGLACLAMIARYWGHEVDLNVMRQKFLISLTGSSMQSIIRIADTLHLSSRPLRLELEEIPKLQLPAILHWDMNHFVVLKSIKRGRAEILDPALGRRLVPMRKLSDHFTGVALELTPCAEFSPIKAQLKTHLSLLWQRLVGLKRALFQTLTLSLILQIIILAAPFYLQIVVDGVLPAGDLGLLWTVMLGFGALAILQAVSEAVRSWAILVYGNQMSAQMTGNVFRHLLRLPVAYFEKRNIGDLISRMGSTRPIQQALTQSLTAVLIDGVMASLMIIVMWLYAPVLAGIVLASVALLALATILIYPHIRQSQEEAITTRAAENTHMIESIRASTAIKLFGREAEREAAWRNLYTDVINANVTYGRFVILQRFAETLITGLQLVLVVFAAADMMSTDGNNFTIGMLFAFLAYRQYFTGSAAQLVKKAMEFRLLSLHLDRLSDIIFAEGERNGIMNRVSEALPNRVSGHIAMNKIWFRYSDEDPWVLKDLSLDIPAGSMITITGRSGGGKTTLLKIMLGLYAPVSGDIRIDGHALMDFGIYPWRQSIGVVMQDDTLLSGTIADNISMFDPAMDMDAVVKASKAARVDAEIMAMPMQYLSMVGDMGSILSGGQKQRILLARALYRDPQVLFLDEGTANLDVETEKNIVDVISAMTITRIIVAHRPAFLEASTKILTI